MTVTYEATIHRYIGLSTDTKPTGVPIGSFFFEYDTKIIYKCYDGTNWAVYNISADVGTSVFTTSAATTTTLTAAALADVAGQYVGQMAVPLQGAMAGEGRYITAYNGTNQITVSPAWAADPDAGGNIEFAIVSGALGYTAAEVQTSSVASGAGSNATTTRLGLLVRWLTDNVSLASVLGTLADAASTTINTATTVMSYLKGILGQTNLLPDGGALTSLAQAATLNGQLILTPLFNTTTTTKNASVTLFAVDALGSSVKDIKLAFYLVADAAATFTVSVYKTRAGDLITFTQDMVKTWTIALPAAAGAYSFELGDLEEGLQMEVRVAQDNAGNATNVIDATLTFEG